MMRGHYSLGRPVRQRLTTSGEDHSTLSSTQILVLGALAGLTIFIGLPLGQGSEP